MILEHRDARPSIDPSAYVAPTAVVCGDVHVHVGAGARCEVRIHGVVHVNTVLAPETVVPSGWIAAGDPAQLCQSEFLGAHREDRECG